MRVCVFTVGGETLALPVPQVIELFAAESVTPVPTAPASVAGVVHRLGQVLPVVRLPAPLARAESVGAGQGLLVLEHQSTRVAIPVERVLGIRRVPGALAPEAGAPEWVAGVLEIRGAAVRLLDLGALMTHWSHEVAEQVRLGEVPARSTPP